MGANDNFEGLGVFFDTFHSVQDKVFFTTVLEERAPDFSHCWYEIPVMAPKSLSKKDEC